MLYENSSSKLQQSETLQRYLPKYALIVVLFASCAAAQTKPAASNAKDQSEGLIYSVKGPDLFRVHCAACHGEDAKGDGPVAADLKTKVPDLTVLAKNNGGQFPTDRVRKMISGDETLAAHGSREMPVFGPIFRKVEPYESLNQGQQDLATVRLDNLIAYLQLIQRK